jgi:hypothetical protein
MAVRRERRRSALAKLTTPGYEKHQEPPLNVTADIEPKAWQDQLFDVLKRADIRQGRLRARRGHSRLIHALQVRPRDPRRGVDDRGGGRRHGRPAPGSAVSAARC